MLTMEFDLSSVSFSKMDKQRGLRIPEKLTPKLAEEIGIHIGDGSLNFYKRTHLYSLRGHLSDDKKYYTDFIKFLYKDLFGLEVNMRRWPDVIGFQVGSKAIGTFKSSVLGLPLGPKKEIEIPNFILESDNSDVYGACIRGIFDTDGCLSFEKKSRQKPYYPRIMFTTTSKKLTENLVSLLRKRFNFNLSSWYKDYKNRNWNRLNYICVRGKRNLRKWFKIIGSNNPKNSFKFRYWDRHGYFQMNKNSSS